MRYQPPDWFVKMPAKRGDPDEIVLPRIARHNAIRRREALIKNARRCLVNVSLWRGEEARWLNQAAAFRRAASQIPPEQPGE